jgi:hypothetical protein
MSSLMHLRLFCSAAQSSQARPRSDGWYTGTIIADIIGVLTRFRLRQRALRTSSESAFSVGDGGLFMPVDGKLGKPTRGSDRLVDAPAHIGIDDQRKVGAEMIAHRSVPLEILRKARPAYLHLDRAESLFEVVVGLMQQLIQRKNRDRCHQLAATVISLPKIIGH